MPTAKRITLEQATTRREVAIPDPESGKQVLFRVRPLTRSVQTALDEHVAGRADQLDDTEIDDNPQARAEFRRLGVQYVCDLLDVVLEPVASSDVTAGQLMLDGYDQDVFTEEAIASVLSDVMPGLVTDDGTAAVPS